MVKKSRRRNNPQGADLEAQPEGKGKGTRIMSALASVREGETSGITGSAPVRKADREAQPGSSTQSQAAGPQKDDHSNPGIHDRPGHRPTPGDVAQSIPTGNMVGDFDDNANALWSLHVKEARSHDEARIQTLKDDMDGVLIFAGLFSAALTSFVTDKIHDLQVDPAQQMVYYQQQNVALLAQISKQVSSIAPQVSIPSASPPPYPNFSPSSSDVRVNAYWFMSLVFSISAALLATLVQQWVRDYMHVFQRYSNPLKSARLRQYLYEGAEGWYMPVVAESVPGLVHVSLFLFFLGLGDSLLAVHTTVAVTTIVPITVCGLLYVLTMFAPILNPQSPFQNPFSCLIWYLAQKMHPRSYSDRATGGALKALSTNMSEGQAQLAMEANDERKDRDARAIQWLIHNRTEHDEMESFVLAIPGAFTSKWGVEVWRNVSEVKQHEDASFRPTGADPRVLRRDPLLPQHIYRPRSLLRSVGHVIGIRSTNGIPRDVLMTRSMPQLNSGSLVPDDPHASDDLAIHDLCKRIRYLLDTCKNHSLFTNKELWRMRARGCVETVASLVFCADVKLELFGDLGRLLCELGEFERIRDLSAAGSDGAFVARWTCLSLVDVTRRISNHDTIEANACLAVNCLSQFRMENDGERTPHDDDDENALKNARRVDNYFETASQICIDGLRRAFRPWEVGRTEEQVRDVLARNHVVDISTLERIAPAADHMLSIDSFISQINSWIHYVSLGLIVHLPGVSFDQTGPSQPIRFFNPSASKGQAFTPQLVFLCRRLRRLCSYTPKLRDIIDGRGSGAYQETLESLRTLWGDADRGHSIVRQRHLSYLMERQLWRLQDLRDGGGFGFSVELFFLVLADLLSTASSWDTHSALYIGTFRSITSDWKRHRHSIGTQRVILNLICDVARPDRGMFSNRGYPRYITDELLVLLKNMMEGQSGSHFDDAMKELDAVPHSFQEGRLFGAEAMGVISRSRAPLPSS